MRRFVLALGVALAAFMLTGADTPGSANAISWSQLVTPGGALIAAPLITGFVQLLKSNASIDARISGATLAFITSAVIYILAVVALWPLTSDGLLNVFAVWVTCGLAAVGIKATTEHIDDVRMGTAGNG